MKRILMIVAALMCFATFSFAVGESVTEKEWKLGTINILALNWTSGTNGNLSIETDRAIRGMVYQAAFSNAVGTVTAYDVALIGRLGQDVLEGQGTNITADAILIRSAGSIITNSVGRDIFPIPLNERLTLSVSAAGTNESGTVLLYTRP